LDIKNKVSVIIPTHNRHGLLNRSLNYWLELKLNIIVFDSSDKIYKNKSDKIKYYHRPNISFVNKICEAVNKINTEYCILCADDDFITFNGLQNAIKFLEKNKDYGIAHGDYYSFFVKHNMKKEIIWKKGYIGNTIDQETPQKRLLYHFNNYNCPTFYGVHRTKVLKDIWRLTKDNVDDNRFSELLPTMLSVIYGKIKRIEGFYCARERLLRKEEVPDIFNFIEDNSYEYKFKKFKDCLTKELSFFGDIKSKDAENVVDRGMNTYLSNSSQNKKIPIQIFFRLKLIYLSEKFKLMYYLKQFYKKSFLHKKVEPNEYLDWFSAEDLKEFNKIKSLVLKYHDYK
jgi:glycosyltransferase domain-containing protein